MQRVFQTPSHHLQRGKTWGIASLEARLTTNLALNIWYFSSLKLDDFRRLQTLWVPQQTDCTNGHYHGTWHKAHAEPLR